MLSITVSIEVESIEGEHIIEIYKCFLNTVGSYYVLLLEIS